MTDQELNPSVSGETTPAGEQFNESTTIETMQNEVNNIQTPEASEPESAPAPELVEEKAPDAIPAEEASEAKEAPVAEEMPVAEEATEEVEEGEEEEANEGEDNPVVNYSECSLIDLIQAFTRLLEAEDKSALLRDGEIIKSAFYKKLNGEKAGSENEETPAETAEEDLFKKLYSHYKVLRADFIRNIELQKEKNLEDKLTIIEELKNLLDKQEDLNHTFPEFRSLQNRWKAIGPVPLARTKDVWDTYQHFVEKFYDFVKINNELRDLDFKKNLELKTTLCDKAEELINESSVLSAFHRLQKLHEQWREIGPIERDLRESLWERFKASTTAINKRHQEYFELQKVKQKENLEAKIALCEKAEAVVELSKQTEPDWNKLAKELEVLQKEWKEIGFASKKENQKVYDRFRAACDAFYNAKREFYSAFKEKMQENMSAKVALCEQAEALQASEDWRKTTDVLINLQKQWKTIGPVPRKQSDAIWKRFRAACDTFFTAKAANASKTETSYDANLAAKLALIEEIKAYNTSEHATEENYAALKDFQGRWSQIGFVPIREKDKVQAQYKEELDKQYATLRGSAPERRAQGRYRKDEAKAAPRSEREKLVLKFHQMESDIAVWENNIGFFARSANADKLVADINHKIEQAKAELAQLEETIKQMDKQAE